MKNKKRHIKPLFEVPEWWENDWQGMPEFKQEDQGAFKSLIVNFENKDDMEAFAELVEQRITFRTQSIWYPKADIGRIMNKKYIDSKK